jgi:hypothetical protein
MTHSNGSIIARGAFFLFALAVIIVNAAVTWQFGTAFLAGAFGIRDPFTAAMFGGAYAILMLDVAALVWLLVYMRAAETTAQRAIAIVTAAVSFFGSLVATGYMLAANTAGILATHAAAVGSVAQIAMIAIVCMHAILATFYLLKARDESVLQATIDAKTSAIGTAVTQAKSDVQNMVPTLAAMMSDVLKVQILSEMGFTHDGRQLVYNPGDGKNKIYLAPQAGSAAGDLDALVEERLRERRGNGVKPYYFLMSDGGREYEGHDLNDLKDYARYRAFPTWITDTSGRVIWRYGGNERVAASQAGDVAQDDAAGVVNLVDLAGHANGVHNERPTPRGRGA